MRPYLVVAAALVGLQMQARAQGFECPEPSKQVGASIKGEIGGQVQGLLKMAGVDVKGAVETSVVNLFEKYPNADRVAIIQNFQSTACNVIRNSSLPDEKKFGLILELATSMEKFLR